MLPQSSSSQEMFSGRRPARQEAAGPGQSLAFPTDKTQKVRSARGRKRFSSYKTPSHEGLTVQCPAARHAGPRPAPASALPSAFSGPRGAWAVAALHAARPSPHDTHLQRCFIQNPHFLNELLQLLGAEQGDDRLAGGRGHAVVGSRGLAEALRVLPQLRKAFGGEQHQ